MLLGGDFIDRVQHLDHLTDHRLPLLMHRRERKTPVGRKTKEVLFRFDQFVAYWGRSLSL